MAKYDVSIYLTNGATVKLAWDFSSNPTTTLESELEKDKCTLKSSQEGATLVIRRPKDSVVGYLVDRS